MVPRRFGSPILASAFDETCCRSCSIVFVRRIRPRRAGMEGSVSVSPSFGTSSSSTAEPWQRTARGGTGRDVHDSPAPRSPGEGFDAATGHLVARPIDARWTLSSLHGRKVLVVEDHDDARELVASVLGAAGAEVITAASSRKRSNGIDWHNAGSIAGGSRSSRRRRLHAPAAHPRTNTYRDAALPAVALTAYARASDRERALAAGFLRLHHQAGRSAGARESDRIRPRDAILTRPRRNRVWHQGARSAWTDYGLGFQFRINVIGDSPASSTAATRNCCLSRETMY